MFTKGLTEPEIRKKIMRWCDAQERSQQEVRDKLYSLGLHSQQVEPLIAHLIAEGFLNEERFALAFARGKFRMLQWGRIKIRMALKQKKVTDYCIRKALASIPEEDYRDTIRRLAEKRLKLAKGDTPYKRQYSAAQYVISRGFEPELVMEQLRLSEE